MSDSGADNQESSLVSTETLLLAGGTDSAKNNDNGLS
jgi:hypothetical protein